MRDPIPNPTPQPDPPPPGVDPPRWSDDTGGEHGDDLERASWDDWRRTFSNRALANLFGRAAPGSA